MTFKNSVNSTYVASGSSLLPLSRLPLTLFSSLSYKRKLAQPLDFLFKAPSSSGHSIQNFAIIVILPFDLPPLSSVSFVMSLTSIPKVTFSLSQ